MIPNDYLERVYAGVLGKIIGVYLGRPFERWTHERILRELGPIGYYVHERLVKPLVVIDDDISWTLIFVRALPDFENQEKIGAAEIGETWLNYIIEKTNDLMVGWVWKFDQAHGVCAVATRNYSAAKRIDRGKFSRKFLEQAEHNASSRCFAGRLAAPAAERFPQAAFRASLNRLPLPKRSWIFTLEKSPYTGRHSVVALNLFPGRFSWATPIRIS
jgi:hypothetical protein